MNASYPSRARIGFVMGPVLWMLVSVGALPASGAVVLTRQDAVNAAAAAVSPGPYAVGWCPNVDYGSGAGFEGVLPAGTTVRPYHLGGTPYPGNTVTLTAPMYVFFVDDAQHEMFAHGTRFVYVDATVSNPSLAAGTIVVQQQGWWPVIQRPSQPEEELFGATTRYSASPSGYTNLDGFVFGTLVPPVPSRPVRLPEPEGREITPDEILSNANNCGIIITGVDPAAAAGTPEAGVTGSANDFEQQLRNRGVPAGRIHKRMNASKKQLRDAIQQACSAVPPCDKIYVYFGTHGLVNQLQMTDGMVSADTLCAIFKPLGSKSVPVCMMIEACHSGSLIDELRPKFPTGVIITVTDAANQGWADTVTGQGDFGFFWYAFRNCWNSAAADSNGDGTVDWAEAFKWVCHPGNGDVPFGGSNWDVKTKNPQLAGLPTKSHVWKGPISGAWYVEIWRDTDKDGKFDQCDWGRDDDCDGNLDVAYLNCDADEDGKNERTECIRDTNDDGTPETRYTFDDPNDDGSTDNITCYTWNGSGWTPTVSAPRRSTNQYVISPQQGSAQGGTPFIIQSVGPVQWFNPGIQVFIGSAASHVQLLNPTQIIGETQGYQAEPSRPQLQNVIVADFNPSSPSYGFDELVERFDYTPEIFVDSVDPAEGPCNTPRSVAVHGGSFLPSAQVLVNGSPVPSLWIDGQTLHAVMPAGFCGTSVDVSVASGGSIAALSPGIPRLNAVLLDEPFAYPNGNLVGNGGWTAHSGAGSVPIQVSSGAAVLVNGAGSREDANRPLSPAPASNAKTYAAFNLVVSDTGTSLQAPDYFAHFKPSANQNFRARVFVARDTLGGGAFKVGLGLTSAGVGEQSTLYHPTSCLLGQSYKVVTSYDAATGTAELWVNPVDVSSPKVVRGPLLAAAGEVVGTYALRQGGASTVTERVDDLEVGESFGEVCPPPGDATLHDAYTYLPAADVTPPALSCPADLKLIAGVDGLARTPPGYGATGSDETALYAVVRNDLGALPSGAQFIDFEAIDAAGNRTTCTAIVNVNDPTSVEDAPAAFTLGGAFPNPYLGSGAVRFALPRPERVRIALFSTSGQRVAILTDRLWESGRHEISWRAADGNGRGLPSGMYFLAMEAGSFRATRRVTVLR